MTGTHRQVLYSPALLAMAIELADVPLDASAPYTGRAVSRTCGSVIAFGCSLDANDSVQDIGLGVAACAVGQAAAAIFANATPGMTPAQIADTADRLEDWLKVSAPSGILPRLSLLEKARDHPARHEAILLPWRAALDALCKAEAPR